VSASTARIVAGKPIVGANNRGFRLPRFRKFVVVASLFLPWPLRRHLLQGLLKYRIAPDARLGFSFVCPDRLVMEGGSRVGHFTVIKSIDLLHLSENSNIGSLNWISGIGLYKPRHFNDETARAPQLLVGRHASVTARHMIDCSNKVTIGEFSTIAGAGTHIFTHAIDVRENRQRSAPVEIGRYCFVGAACVILKGSRLPDCSILGANSTLHKSFTETHTIYSGVPAQACGTIDPEAGYFFRTEGFVP
jgi:acetyltransferase-like isoleucine patch superfamily enzyme